MTPDAGPTAGEVTQANIAYHAELATSYDERQELFHPRVVEVYRSIFERHVFSRFPAGAALSALDVGCGTGLLEAYLLPRVTDLVAFDVSPEMLAVARAKYPQVEFQIGDAFDMPPAAQRQFDIVCENAFLHHVKHYEDALLAMAERLRPGGVMFLGYEPNALAFAALAPLRAIYKTLLPEQRVEAVNETLGSEVEALAEYHQYYGGGLSARKIARLLRRSGFREVQIFYRLEHFFGLLQDRTGMRLLDRIPTFLMRLAGPLAISFHIVAHKKG